MTIDFYYLPESAPCRSVLLVAKAVGVELNLKHTDLQKGDHLKPEFVKINPQHTIPTLDDNGFVLWESRAILGYLAQQYGKDDSLYPKDPKKRALVDARLYFDIGTLAQRFGEYFYPVLFAGASFDPAKRTRLEEAYEFLDKFLEGQTWVAGDSLTIADIAIVASVSTAEAAGIEISKYPNVTRWFGKAKSAIPGYDELNHSGAMKFKEMVKRLTAGK